MKTTRVEQRVHIERVVCERCGGFRHRVEMLPPNHGNSAGKYRYICRDCGTVEESCDRYPMVGYEDAVQKESVE